MIANKIKNKEAPRVSEHSKHIRKAYESPKLTCFEALDIKTGVSNVPENNNGLLES